MIKFIKDILIKREAVLFDTPLFIVKSFAAVMLGYVLFSSHPLLGKDMISVLLGLMLTLQPVNVTGLKSGWEQLSASIIGGGVTALIVLIGGVNLITVPLAVAATLYITLRINWRSMSVIAVFTSIYMTQYIQLTTQGEPSMYLTLRLRLLALGAGILTAVVLNFLFSFIFYRSMMRKRTVFTIEKLVSSLKTFKGLIGSDKKESFIELEKNTILLFGDIDYILGGLMDVRKKKTKDGKTAVFIKKLRELRDINHFVLDMVMLEREGSVYAAESGAIVDIIESLSELDDLVTARQASSWEAGEYRGIDKNITRIYKSMQNIANLQH